MISSLKIGPVVYKVEEVKDLQEKRADGTVRSLAGYILYTDEAIQVEQVLSIPMKLMGILHEATHGMLYQGGLNDIDERVSINLGYSLYAFIRDNPELVKLIQEQPGCPI